MSLSKQLLILVSAIFLIIFSVNFLLSVNKIRDYLESESQVHAQDTATSLGLSLSPYIGNENDPVLETMINAIFDMGYYGEIRLVNVDNKPLVTVKNDKIFTEVPQWFIDFLPIQTATAESEISSGWSIGGTVYVTINPGFAYLKLYQLAQSSFNYSLITFTGAVLLLFLILRFMLLPLKAINELALAIANGQFKTIEKLPWTLEVRNVAISMNTMSKKIEGAISSFTTKLDSIGKKLQLDDLTGLHKKSSFETDMKQLFMADIEAFVFVIKIDGLASLAKEHGSDTIDQFLKRFAGLLNKVSAQYEPGLVTPYRFFGSEFAILARSLSREQAEQLAQSVSALLAGLGDDYRRKDIAHIGIAMFNPLGTTADILAAANEAFEQAQLIGSNSYYFRIGSNHAKDIAEWKDLVFNIIDQKAYQVSYIGEIKQFATDTVFMEEAFTQAFDPQGKVIPIGTFVSIAEKFAKIVELDQGVTQRVMDHIRLENISHAVAVNLSTRTVKNADFRVWLAGEIRDSAIAAQLVFSISAYAVAKEANVYRDFFEFIHSLGAKVMLKRFETQSMPLDMAKDLRPDYIRLARDLGSDLSRDESKKAFIETMQQAAQLLDIVILAENVQSDADYAVMREIGLFGASR
ncbi:MAG: LapD/MoxY N-terminal periplasmic domain-containing protein [Methylobacter sp.]|nr:LapD/MoxY N-terminal periplasmic domain-containing protein [Methylobacter sp.]MDP2429751.1 LapD/MoxY N-terminal periplasmic domain-containing protein [Methylobacter sp.]MDP3055619.1 LapD/MoxY N-terminal periplasmic domain-containing protein [Methylobacter sp.]MDP3362454.1 LapD/MoxY N-terminal periplasmic domain-containing protein [Methylobacter sp.]MDZ4220932.1 LapD/MoxY N-terminal periplasmic domain-containing protein [Methylobacter sp.]